MLTEWILLALGAGLALFFAHKGFHTYTAGPAPDDAFEERRPELAGFLANAWGIDRSYYSGIVEPLKLGAVSLYSFVDQVLIDGTVNGAATVTRNAAQKLRGLVDGNVKTYALWMGSGAAVLALLMAVV